MPEFASRNPSECGWCRYREQVYASERKFNAFIYFIIGAATTGTLVSWGIVAKILLDRL